MMKLRPLSDKPYKGNSIAFTLSVVVSILILISVFLTSIVSYHRYTRNFQEQFSQKTSQTLEQLSLNIDTYLEELFHFSLFPYYNDDIMTAIESKYDNELDSLKQRREIESFLNQIMVMPRKDITNVFILTDEIYYSGRMPKSINYSEDFTQYSWYQKCMYTQDVIFIPTQLEQLVSYPKQRVFSIAKQLRSIKNIDRIIGVIKVDASYEGIETIVKKISMGKDGGIFIIDKHKNIIYSNISKEKSDFIANSLLQTPSSFVQSIDRKEYLINTAVIESADWTVVGLSSLDELNLEARNTLNFSLVLATLCSLGAIVIMLFFTKRFLNPLMEIVTLMKQVREGDFGVVFQGKTQGEIGYLASSFNSMVSTINDNINKNTQLIKKIYETEMLNKEARINALQSQIKPHFLYNTLNMISIEVQLGKYDNAVDNIDKLHYLLRSMAKWKKDVSLEEEFKILESYLGIQMCRFENRLEFFLDLPDFLKDDRIIPFILQPLVENSVVHGCETLTRKTTITVKACSDKSSLYISVSDNGCGIPAERLSVLQDQLSDCSASLDHQPDFAKDGEHIGLNNVNRRIKLTYGSMYGVTLNSEYQKGTQILVKLPLIEKGS